MLEPYEFIKKFLELNGFAKQVNTQQLVADIFRKNDNYVFVYDSYYTIRNYEGDVSSDNLNIYWLIGYLTYYNIIDKNYKLPE